MNSRLKNKKSFQSSIANNKNIKKNKYIII